MSPETSDRCGRLPVESDWRSLVDGVQAGDQVATTELYHRFFPGLRYYFGRQFCPDDTQDLIQNTILTAIEALRRGELREPDCLRAWVRTIAKRKAAHRVAEIAKHRRCDAAVYEAADSAADLDNAVYVREQAELVRRALQSLKPREIELLTRFYVHEQKPEQIMREMHLNPTQYRLRKSRAKSRFGEAGRRFLKPVLALADAI